LNQQDYMVKVIKLKRIRESNHLNNGIN